MTIFRFTIHSFLLLLQKASMHDCFSILPRLRLKYDQQFHAHFANPLNQIIYDHIHTPIRTLAREMHFLEQEEWLCWLMPEGEGFAAIAESADLFESKNEAGMLPIMLQSKSMKILERRRKRLTKLKQNQANSRETSQEQGKTIIFLGESFQNFTFSKAESSEPSSFYGSSFCNAYSLSNSAQSIVLRLSGDFQSSKSTLHLKSIVQATLQHLIMDFQLKTGSKGVRKGKDGRLSGDSSTSEAVDSIQSMESSIETVVREQMEKYKIGPLYGRTPMTSQRSHRSVRDKAERYLNSIRREWLE